MLHTKGIDYEINTFFDKMEDSRKRFNKFFSNKIDTIYHDFLMQNGINDTSAKLLTIKTMNLIMAKYEYYHGYAKLLSRPFCIIFDPSNFCQLHCPGCMHSHSYDSISADYWGKDILSWDSYKKIIDLYAPYAFNSLMYNNGEPFINKDTPRMIEYIRGFCTSVTLSSNMSLNIDAESIVKSGLDHLICSIDGATQEIYEKYRKGGNLNIIKENLDKLRVEKIKQKKSCPNTVWQFLAFEHNENEIEMAKRIAEELGVSQFMVGDPFSVRHDDPNIKEIKSDKSGWYSLTAFDYKGLCKNKNSMIFHLNAEAINTEYERFVNRFKHIDYSDKDYYLKCESYCDSLWKTLCFDAKERIIPCCAGPLAHFENDIIMGKAFESDKEDCDQFNLEKLVNMRRNVNQKQCCISCEGKDQVNYDTFHLNRDLKEYTFFNCISNTTIDELTNWSRKLSNMACPTAHNSYRSVRMNGLWDKILTRLGGKV